MNSPSCRTRSRLSGGSPVGPDNVLGGRPAETDWASELSALRARWQGDGKPDAAAYLAAHPRLAARRDVVLELAYEDFCLRRQAGTPIDPEAFCARFPSFRSDVRRVLEVQSELERRVRQLDQAVPIRWPGPGDTVLGFVLQDEIGRGGFGRVFLAREPELGNRTVVVKLSPNGNEEAQTLGPLAHPNIVSVHGAQEDRATGLTVVCMPYRGRATLDRVIRRLHAAGPAPTRAHAVLEAAAEAGVVPPELVEAADEVFAAGSLADAVAHLGAQLAEALAYLHTRGVFHRDLKPANVLLTSTGRPLLLDFNLAQSREAKTATVGGTLPYMAPEQLLGCEAGGDAATASGPRSDIYALGVLLHELLTGRHPFGILPREAAEGEVREHLLACQRRGPAALPRRTLAPSALTRLIDQCLAWDPAARPQSAAALAAGLRQCQPSVVEGPTPRPDRRGWSVRAGLAAGAALTALILIGSARLTPDTPGGVPAAASRDPRAALTAGLRAAAASAPATAIAELSAALRSETDPAYRAWAHYARGRAHHARGEIGVALADFEHAFALVPDWRFRASMGYCRSCLDDHERAVRDYTWVIDHGAGNAALFANRAWSTFQAGDTAALKRAAEDLEAALLWEPSLATAHAGRIRVAAHQLLALKDRPPGLGPDDLAAALTLGPKCDSFYFDCLLVCVEAAGRLEATGGQAPWLELGIESAARAVETGLAPQCLGNRRVQEQLGAHPRFRALVDRLTPRAQPVSAMPPVRFVDPVPDGGNSLSLRGRFRRLDHRTSHSGRRARGVPP